MRKQFNIKISMLIFYITLALFPILPPYFRLIPSLMMYSALMFLCIIVCFANGKIGNLKQISFLSVFAICNLICFIYHGEINEVIKFLLAPIGLFLVMLKMIDTETKFYKAIDILIWSSAFVCIAGIIQEVTSFNIFSILNNSGYQEAALSIRMGLKRIYTSFLMPINYGNYLMVMVSLVVYRINTKNCTHKKQFQTILYLLFTNLVLTGSRAPLMVAFFLYALFLWKSGTSKLVREIIKMVGVVLLVGVFGLLIGLNIFSSLSNMVNMVLGLFNSSFMSKISVDFGGNEGGVGDRLMLFIWIWEAVQNNLIFGIGRAGKSNFVIMRNQWSTKTSVENEYLATLLIYGFVGLVGELSFFFASFRKAVSIRKYQNENDKIPFSFISTWTLIGYFLLFFTVSLQMDERIFYVLIGLIICYINLYLKKKIVHR